MSVERLPDEMISFVIEQSGRNAAGARLGRLSHRLRPAIETPHYAVVTSRGVVPHVSPDVVERHTRIRAAYFGLEDFIEKSAPNSPMLENPQKQGSLLETWTGLSSSVFTMLGPRRIPRIQCRAQSTDASIPICTSVGFRTLEEHDYNNAAERIVPDAVTCMADIAHADRISSKRIQKMVDRTQSWFLGMVTNSKKRRLIRPVNAFATVLPLERDQQQLYLEDLSNEEYGPYFAGVTLYDPQSATIVPKQISHLPRYCIADPQTPQQLLDAISLGLDIITAPFVTAITERGVAFQFSFPAPDTQTQLPLGVDMWSATHATSVIPLTVDCSCYTCTRHHRAYLHHLLQAKEMLAWTLLQVHNLHTLDNFFAGIRSSIQAGTLEQDLIAFKSRYEDDFLVGVGADRGPRIRGYQMKSIGKGEDKKREKVWGRFEDSTDVSGTQSPGAVGVENDQGRKIAEAEEHGALVDDEQGDLTARDLERLGLAEEVQNNGTK